MRFDIIVILGSGKIACDVVKCLSAILKKKQINVFEIFPNTLSSLQKICHKYEIQYSNDCTENDIEETIERINGTSKLIISANNLHIFSQRFLSNKDIEVINFHYSYLPEYRGMNIPTWVIYNNEDYTGVTWHYVTEDIDCGNIIAQKRISIDADSTAFGLTYWGMKAGIELFKDFIIRLLTSNIKGKRIHGCGKLYLKHTIPENGYLDTSLPIDEVFKLLRSFDYGKAHVIDPLKVKFQAGIYQIKKYKKIYNREYVLRENEIEVVGNAYSIIITLIKCNDA